MRERVNQPVCERLAERALEPLARRLAVLVERDVEGKAVPEEKRVAPPPELVWLIRPHDSLSFGAPGPPPP